MTAADLEAIKKELTDGRFLLMQVLADDCEDRGEIIRREGWRWLAHNRKWPNCRVGNFYWQTCHGDSTGVYEQAGIPLGAKRFLAPKSDKDLWELLNRTALAVGRWLPNTDNH